MVTSVVLDFGNFTVRAEIFDNSIGGALVEGLPRTIALTYWGAEAYGGIGVDLGTDAPQPKIPAGGIAYTNQGNYLCFFFGQDPAWPVEYIGTMEESGWRQLAEEKPAEVTVRRGH